MTITEQTSVGAVVADNPRAARVFEKYGIDFCCKGHRPLGEAAQGRGVELAALLNELATFDDLVPAPRFTTWSLALLTEYIVENHHHYIRTATPVLLGHLEKVARVHGARHPEMKRVETQFKAIADDLTQHMWKEENILFPYIRDMVVARKEGRAPMPAPFSTVEMPVARMMSDHEQAGDEMAMIRDLTSGYQVPEDGCGTYRACLQELQDFEHDLHAHVHLENNLLFPRAMAFERDGEDGR